MNWKLQAVVTIVFRMKKNFYILLLCSLNVWLAKNNLYVIVLLLYCSLENTQWQERTQKHQKLSKRTGDISIEIWTKYANLTAQVEVNILPYQGT